MATIKDVAASARVSTASVSRVFSDHPSVTVDMRSRVLAAAETLSYRPSALGRSLRAAGTKTIGLVVSDLVNPYFAELARAVEDAARGAGYGVIMGNADENPEQQDQYVRFLLTDHVDGLIVVPTTVTSALLHEAARLDHALVLVDRPAKDIDAPLVAADSSQAIDELVDHLVNTARQRIAVIAGPHEAGTARERLASLRASLANHGAELPPELVFSGDFRRRSGADGLSHLLSVRARPDAIIAMNGQMAMGALEAMISIERAPRISDDLAFAAVDDLEAFRLVRPSITAIAQPTARIGRTAFETLHRLMSSGVAEEPERVPCQLILRGSTAPRRER